MATSSHTNHREPGHSSQQPTASVPNEEALRSHLNSHLFLAAEKASLGKVTLVTGDNGLVSSLAFTPNEHLTEKVSQW